MIIKYIISLKGSDRHMSDDKKKGYTDKDFFQKGIKSDIVKSLLNKANISQTEIASYLGCSVQSFRNKMNRDSFSLYDFIVICHVCNADFTISTKDDNTYFSLSPSETLTDDEVDRIRQITLSRADKNTKDLQKIIESLPDDEKAKILQSLK